MVSATLLGERKPVGHAVDHDDPSRAHFLRGRSSVDPEPACALYHHAVADVQSSLAQGIDGLRGRAVRSGDRLVGQIVRPP